jgi:hypothetical protein
MGQKGNHGRASILFFLLFAVMFTLWSYKTGLGSIRHPGSGLLPLMTGILLIVTCLAAFVGAGSSEEKTEAAAPIASGRAILMLAALASSVILFFLLGFILTEFLLMIIFFAIMEARLRSKAVWVAAVTTLVTYLVFSVGLSLNFPKGLLGL